VSVWNRGRPVERVGDRSVLVRDKLRTPPSNVYDADAVEKTVEDLTILITKRGYPFVVVRPTEDRGDQNKRVNLVYELKNGRMSGLSASTFASIRAPGITSFTASSISATAMLTTARSSIAASGASRTLTTSRR
jgi:outer membrane protein assembly factor BamA